ncbi:MAG: peptidoglycan-binding protein [Bacteroidales bacterium]|nr:peptidoglycan-binding protein [Bacteroidales bacterium]MBR5780447.1 peptidoglycan-binding protein [Bacteroidales bacterium]
MKNPYPEPKRVLKRTYPIMMKGTDVKWLQYQLNLKGYNLVVDGKFGNSTRDAVKDFQHRSNLVVDGKVGPATRNTLLSDKDVSSIKTYSKKAAGETKITSNFKVKEFACKDGSDTVKIDDVTVGYLQKARDKFGVPIYINSGYRTSAYNKKVGGASNSYHVKGQAVDHHVKGKVSLMELAKFYESIGCLGIIVYTKSGFVHIDSRTKKYFAIDDGKTIVKKTTFSK